MATWFISSNTIRTKQASKQYCASVLLKQVARATIKLLFKGVKEGDEVVTSGQLKLKNGTHIEVNNKVQPSNNPNPKLDNDHDEG